VEACDSKDISRQMATAGNVNRWMYVGNLDWHMAAAEVQEHLQRFLATVPVKGDVGASRCITDLGVEEVEVVPFASGKMKGRDADKLHQGFALVRFERAAMVEVACQALQGLPMGTGSRLDTLTASIARHRVEKEQAQQEREQREAAELKVKLEKQRSHNTGQKRRRVERMEQELESVFGSMPSPGGKHAVWNWRCLPPPLPPHKPGGAYTCATGCIEWETMPAECDPMRGGGYAFVCESVFVHVCVCMCVCVCVCVCVFVFLCVCVCVR